MPWTDQPGPRPQRSPDELLAAVQQRATVLRRKRRAAVSAGLGGVAVVLLATTALVRAADDPTSELQVVGPATTTTFVTGSTVPEPLPTTITAGPPPTLTTTTGRPPATLPPTTRAAPPTTRATTASTPATTTAPPPAASSTTTTVLPPLPMCDPSDVVVTATLDRTSYPVGSTVNVFVAAQNRSSRACQPVDPGLDFRDSAGTMQGGMRVIDRFTMGWDGPRPSWEPGETLSMPLSSTVGCSPAPCPPGTYTVHAFFGPFRAPPVSFTLT